MAAVVISRATETPPPPSTTTSTITNMPLRNTQPTVVSPDTPRTIPPMPLPDLDSGCSSTPIQIPNKHLASPNPGGIMKFTSPVTPPASPPEASPASDPKKCMDSLLHPPDDYSCLSNTPPVYSIDAPGLAAAVNFTARQPLPDIEQLFPWAHGLHPDNSIQLSFFYARKKAARKTPTCYRGICIVKVGRDMNRSRLKGAIMPEEILPPNPQTPGFLCVDPREGFNVRNFHIQVGKFAGLSDIVVYGEEESDRAEVLRIAKRISCAQMHHRAQSQQGGASRGFPVYSTFVVDCPFSVFENLFPDMVTIDSKGNVTGKVVDFCHWERMEMSSMSRASEIAHNVWLGSTSDVRGCPGKENDKWGVLVESSDLAQMPAPETLRELLEVLDNSPEQLFLEFPSSGTISPSNWTRHDVDGIIDACKWIYAIANGEYTDDEYHDADGDHCMSTSLREPRKVLIHCTDGYTETSLLALAYIMYAESLTVHDAWIKLHTDKKRNFFAYDKDLNFLRYIESSLLDAATRNRDSLHPESPRIGPPEWLYRMDGSLPSRVLPYMYLGNLLHANNCGLLQALGIKRVLSIGEEVTWGNEERAAFGPDNVLAVKDLQDNGCDSLECRFRRCLEFIDEGHRADEPTLVHCRVGVSRSATICIAEVMRTLKMSLPRAYCYVRARRLNVIIQPHLRFMYELLKFEESLTAKSGCAGQGSPKRELEWLHVAREVAAMNRPYTRQN